MALFDDRVSLPDWVQWLAQDADGVWWGYEAEPLQFDRGWYENELGRRIRILAGKPDTDWRQTLRKAK
jgi:hypothetical protein